MKYLGSQLLPREGLVLAPAMIILAAVLGVAKTTDRNIPKNYVKSTKPNIT